MRRGELDLDLPTSPGPLRDTLDLPLLADEMPTRPGAKPTPEAADALSLFQDEPKSARRPKGAEARAQPRRCTSCSNVVPAGMSLCSVCGLDLDTGRRIAPLEIVEEDEIPVGYVGSGPPIGLLFVGSITAVGFVLLAMASILAWGKGMEGVPFLLLIWAFGLYASAQFLRRKSIRPLFAALSLTTAIGAVFLIVMPIYYANMTADLPPQIPAPIGEPFDPDAPDIRPLTDNLNLNKITWGVASLLTFAAFAVYLNSPGLRRQFGK